MENMKRPLNTDTVWVENQPNKKRKHGILAGKEYLADNSAMKKTLPGVTFQLKLLMLFLWRGVCKKYNFRLSTEWEAADKFDDLVFSYHDIKRDKIVFLFLQIKFIRDEKKTISVKDLLTNAGGNSTVFSLQKYFISYRKIISKSEFKDNDLRNFLIWTNINFDRELSNSFEPIAFEDDILSLDYPNCSTPSPKYFKLKNEFPEKETLKSMLRNSSDLYCLARILIECLLDGKSIQFGKSKNDNDSKLFKLYQFALVKEIIDVESHKLKPAFISGEGLSSNAKEFRNAFEEIFDSRRSDRLQEEPIIEGVNRFTFEFAKLILNEIEENISENTRYTLSFSPRTDVKKSNYSKLAGYVIVEHYGKMVFSAAFLDKELLPGNLETFRSILMNNVSNSELSKFTFKFHKGFKTCRYFYVNRNTFWKHIKDIKLTLWKDFGRIDNSLKGAEQFSNYIESLLEETESKGERIVKLTRKGNNFGKSMDKLWGHVLIEKNGEIKFSPEFLADGQLPANFESFRCNLKNKWKFNFKELNEYRFIISNFPKTDLPNRSELNNDINSFLDKLIFAVNQPNEESIIGSIELEIENELSIINSDLIVSDFQKKILDWMKAKEGLFLSHEDGLQFFNDAKTKLYELSVIGFTWYYSVKVKEFDIAFSDAQEDLNSFFDSNEKQILNFINEEKTILGSIKVYNCLKNIPKYKKGGSHLFITLGCLVDMQGKILKAFAGRSTPLLVIEYEAVNKSLNSLLSALSDIIKSDNKKKIIFITKSKKDLTLDESKFSKSISKEINDSNNGFLNLTYESQQKLLKEAIVAFQGKNINLGKLLDDESMQLIDANVLSKLIEKKPIKVGESLPDLGSVKSHYIERMYYRWVIPEEQFNNLNNPDKFFILNNIAEIREQPNDRDIIVISEDMKNDDFQNFCDEYKNHNIFWLKMELNNLLLHKFHGSVENLRNYFNRDSYGFRYKIIDGEPLVIISAEPGMGKSTLLSKISEVMKESNPHFWIVRINLNDCTKHLDELIFDDTPKKACEFLFNTLNLTDPFEKALLKHKILKQGNIVLLFDGFDEIIPTYEEKVGKLLQVLKCTKIEKLWITTRPQMREALEDYLGIMAYNLVPLEKRSQKSFLTKFWSNSLDSKDLDKEPIKLYAEKLLELFTKCINFKKATFTGIPLHTKMLAEAFQDNFKEFYESRIINLPKELDVNSLYERFIKSKFNIYCAEKKKCDLTIPANRNQKDYDTFIEGHELLAVDSLCNERRLLCSEKKHEVKRLIENVRKGEERIGIVDKIINDKARFIHRTFAEYFAAKWFYNQRKVKLIEELRVKIFKYKKYEGLVEFYNNIVERNTAKRHQMK